MISATESLAAAIAGESWPALDERARQPYISLAEDMQKRLHGSGWFIAPMEPDAETLERLAKAFHPCMEGQSVAYLWRAFRRACGV